MAYVLGIDLGTSAVKVTAVNRAGQIVAQSSQEYAISNPQAGYSEQNPEDWVQKNYASNSKFGGGGTFRFV